MKIIKLLEHNKGMRISDVLKLGIFLLPVFPFINSCKKDYNDTLPVVEIESVRMYSASAAMITGRVISQGFDKVEYVGFAYSNSPDFSIDENQILLDGVEGRFQRLINVENDTNYYFQAFAANSYGYALSKKKLFKVPYAPHVTAPCKLPSDTINGISGENGVFSAYGRTANGLNYTFNVSVSTFREGMEFYFTKKPINGVYYTVAEESRLAAGRVYVTYTDFNSFSAKDSSLVYVNMNKDGSGNITFCQLELATSLGTQAITGRFNFIK